MPLRLPAKKPHKYRAQPMVVDGIAFPSKREAARYAELKRLEKAGEIEGLELQPRYRLDVPGIVSVDHRCTIGSYVADFRYFDHRQGGIVVVEDVKGFKTPLYRWKKKHVEAQYGIQIREV